MNISWAELERLKAERRRSNFFKRWKIVMLVLSTLLLGPPFALMIILILGSMFGW